MGRLLNSFPWRRRHMESDLARELAYHVDRRTDDLVRSGMSERDARRQAELEMGRPTQIAEEVRDTWRWAWLEHLTRDLQHATRTLARSPGFAVMIIVTIALGVGANGAMFSFLDRLFVRAPDGVTAPAELHRFWVQDHDRHNPGKYMVYTSFRYPQYEVIAAANPETSIAAYDTDQLRLGIGDDATNVNVAWVSPNYFATLGVGIVLGRHFGPEEARVETPTPVAIISHDLWKRQFGSDSGVIGRAIHLSKTKFTIVGVAAPSFTGVNVNAMDVFAPINNDPAGGQLGQPWYKSFNASLGLIARVPSGTSIDPVLVRSTTAYRHMSPIPGFGFDTAATILAGPIVEARGPGDPQREVAIGLRVAGVALVLLLVACANVATLLLVRATQQKREIALRLALGATRGRIYAQAFTESALLATAGGVVAIGLSWWGGTALRKLLLPNIRFATGALDLRVVGVTIAIAVIVGLVNGIAPVMLARRRSVIEAMKGSQRDGMYQRSVLRSSLLVVQTALSVVLIVGSGLFVRSLGNVRAIRVGYDVDSVVFALPGYSNDERFSFTEVGQAIVRIEERMATEPGVIATARANSGPMFGWTSFRIALPGQDSLPRLSGDNPYPQSNNISESFVATVGMRIVSGRNLRKGDSHAVLVNETMAQTFWPGQNPLGKCILLDKAGACTEVVGVVNNAHRFTMIETPSMNFYLPTDGGQSVVLRIDPARWPAIAARLRQEFKAALPGLETVTLRRMTDNIDRELRPWRLGASLFVAFGLLALVTAAIGVYSVIAYAVSQRTHEMGIRMALGARLSDVLRLVLGEGVKVVAIGAVLGVGIALALGKLVASLLYGVTPKDPVVLATAALTLILVGILAALTPAIRASRVDPVNALRTD